MSWEWWVGIAAVLAVVALAALLLSRRSAAGAGGPRRDVEMGKAPMRHEEVLLGGSAVSLQTHATMADRISICGSDAAGEDDQDARKSAVSSSAKSDAEIPGPFELNGYREEDGAYLAGACGQYQHCDISKGIGKPAPKLEGGFQELMKRAPALETQAYNKVKKCPSCAKICAPTMPNCNSCTHDLSEVSPSHTPNLFIGMIFGLDKIPFPLRISLRAEKPNLLVFDDPLALTRAHILSVPTNMHIPDIRSLFVYPAAGLRLLQEMDQGAWEAMASGQLQDEGWRRQALSADGAALPVEELRKHVLRAFNLPPSQYQLHLQYMLPPLTPQHYALWQKGVHYMKLRHFTYDYVVAGLKALVDAGESLPHAPKLTPAEVVQEFNKRGVDYDAMYEEDMERMGKSNTFLSNWKPEDFNFAVVGDMVCSKKSRKAIQNVPTLKELETADKMALQSYGRPYNADGKPGGMWYSFAREPEVLPGLEAAA